MRRIVLGDFGVGSNKYLHGLGETQKSFLPDPYIAGCRIYRTGDYGRLNSRGLLAIEGRISGYTQIKLRGFRIELAEIEHVLVKEGKLVDAVVTLREDSFPTAHVVFGQEREATSCERINKLRARLPLYLPSYMCPSIIVSINEFSLQG